MSSATQPAVVKDSWQTPRIARTLRTLMALRNQEIGARLRELRGNKPQTIVADELGVAERTYQNWEAGDAKPSYRNLQAIAAYYGVGEDYILSGAANPETKTAPPSDGDTLAEINAKLDKLIAFFGLEEAASEPATIQDQLVGMFREAAAQSQAARPRRT